MRIPSKAAVEKIVARHNKKNLKLRVSKTAAAQMYLLYLVYMKKLAKACDDMALRQNKRVISEDIVTESMPKLLKSLSMIKTMKDNLPPTLARQMSDDSTSDELISDEE